MKAVPGTAGIVNAAPDPGEYGQVVRPLPAGTVSTGTLNNGAETPVSSGAVIVLAANANRKAAIVQNTGSNNVRIGSLGLTANTGLRLIPNAIAIFDEDFVDQGDIYAIRETADSIVFAQEIV
jgi:hypothetical protein